MAERKTKRIRSEDKINDDRSMGDRFERWVSAHMVPVALIVAALCLLAAIRSNDLADTAGDIAGLAQTNSNANQVSLCQSRAQSLQSNVLPYVVLKKGEFQAEGEGQYRGRLEQLRASLEDALTRDCRHHGQADNFDAQIHNKIASVDHALSNKQALKRRHVGGVRPSPRVIAPDTSGAQAPARPQEAQGTPGDGSGGNPGGAGSGGDGTPTPPTGAGSPGEGTGVGGGSGEVTPPPLLVLPPLCLPPIDDLTQTLCIL